MDFARALRMLDVFFEAESIPYAVVGGLALHAYGRTRATLDVDVLVPRRHQDSIVRHLEAEGYETLHRSDGFSNHVHSDRRLGRIDCVYVDGHTERAVFAAASRRLTVDGRELRVPSPEHLIAMKVHAMRQDPSRTRAELIDIAFLMQSPGVSRERVRAYFATAGLATALDEIDTAD